MHGENFILKPYPANSASITDITRDLDMLEEISGFVPDVLILDYADIIGPEDKRADKLEQINQTWMAMKGLAEEKHCAVITATQGNRASGDTKDVKSNQVAGFIAKNDHVDAMYAISQQIVEKRMGIIRVSNPLHRWQECDEEKQVYVLQNLELSQVLLDSEWVQRS
jgi:replicative DNA helicase